MITFRADYLGVRHQLTLIVIDHEAVGGFHQTEVFQTLNYYAHAVFQIEDLWGVPVAGAVDVALPSSRHN